MKTLEVTIIRCSFSAEMQYRLTMQGKVETDLSTTSKSFLLTHSFIHSLTRVYFINAAKTPTFELSKRQVPFAIIKDGKELLVVTLFGVVEGKEVELGSQTIELQPSKDDKTVDIPFDGTGKAKNNENATEEYPTIDGIVTLSYKLLKLSVLSSLIQEKRTIGASITAEVIGSADRLEDIKLKIKDKKGVLLSANKLSLKSPNIFLPINAAKLDSDVDNLEVDLCVTENSVDEVIPISMNVPMACKLRLSNGSFLFLTINLLNEAEKPSCVIHEVNLISVIDDSTPSPRTALIPGSELLPDGHMVMKLVSLEYNDESSVLKRTDDLLSTIVSTPVLAPLKLSQETKYTNGGLYSFATGSVGKKTPHNKRVTSVNFHMDTKNAMQVQSLHHGVLVVHGDHTSESAPKPLQLCANLIDIKFDQVINAATDGGALSTISENVENTASLSDVFKANQSPGFKTKHVGTCMLTEVSRTRSADTQYVDVIVLEGKITFDENTSSFSTSIYSPSSVSAALVRVILSTTTPILATNPREKKEEEMKNTSTENLPLPPLDLDTLEPLVEPHSEFGENLSPLSFVGYKRENGVGKALADIFRNELEEKQKIINILLKDNKEKELGIEGCGHEIKALRHANMNLNIKISELNNVISNKKQDEVDALEIIEANNLGNGVTKADKSAHRDLTTLNRGVLINIIQKLSENLRNCNDERLELKRYLSESQAIRRQYEDLVQQYNEMTVAHVEQSKLIQSMKKSNSKVEVYKNTIKMQEKIIAKMQLLLENKLANSNKLGDRVLDHLIEKLDEPGGKSDIKINDLKQEIERKEREIGMQKTKIDDLQSKVWSLENDLNFERAQAQVNATKLASMKKDQNTNSADELPLLNTNYDSITANKRCAELEVEVASRDYRIKAMESEMKSMAEEYSREIARLRMKLFEYEMIASIGFDDQLSTDDIVQLSLPNATALPTGTGKDAVRKLQDLSASIAEGMENNVANKGNAPTSFTSGTLLITRIQGINLKNVEFLGQMDPYCKCQLGPWEVTTAPLMNSGADVTWDNLSLSTDVTLETLVNEQFLLSVFDANDLRKDMLIGSSATNQLKTCISPTNLGNEVNITTQLSTGSDDTTGVIVITAKVVDSGKQDPETSAD